MWVVLSKGKGEKQIHMDRTEAKQARCGWTQNLKDRARVLDRDMYALDTARLQARLPQQDAWREAALGVGYTKQAHRCTWQWAGNHRVNCELDGKGHPIAGCACSVGPRDSI